MKPRRCSRANPWTRAEAEAVLADAAASGMTLYSYARKHGLKDQVLYGWRLRLERQRAGTASVGRELAFVPVVEAAPVETNGDAGIELAVGPVTVRVTRSFCERTLRRLLPLVVEAVAC